MRESSVPWRGAAAIVPAWLTIAVLVFGAPAMMKVIIGAVFLTTLVSPPAGLLAATALAPFGALMMSTLGMDGFRIADATVVAFLAGWLLRGLEDRPGPRVVAWPAILFGVTLAGSVVTQTLALSRYPGELANLWRWLFFGYYLITVDPIGAVDASRVATGVLLAIAVVGLFRRRPRLAITLPAALVGSATVAAVLSALLWYRIAPDVVLRRYALNAYRVSAHVGDVNAAGSHFVMALCLALGMAVAARRQAAVPWLVAAAGCAFGLWLSASRSAAGAAIIAVAAAAGWLATIRWRPRSKMIAVGAIVLLALAAGAAQLRQWARNPEYRGFTFRTQFNETTLRMIAARPLSGIGIGEYSRLSPQFLSPQLAWTYGSENAHNYFLQLAAELGVAGLVLFVWWIGAGLVRAIRALARAPGDTRLLGTFAGVAAFLGTCFTGHPFLVSDVAMPFWAQFGLLVGLAGSVLWRPEATAAAAARWPRLATAAAGVLLLAFQFAGARRDPVPPESRDITGLYEWEADAEGTRYRWSGEYASIFVPANVTRVYVPVRITGAPQTLVPVGVEARTEGKPGTRGLVGEKWAIFNIPLAPEGPPVRYKRINFRVDRTWQPALYTAGSADMRPVGVQFGEPKLFHEY